MSSSSSASSKVSPCNAAGLTPYEGTRLHGDSPAEERVGHFRR